MMSDTIVIEQTEQQAKLAFEVHRNSQLRRIRLASSSAEARAPEDFPSPPLTVSFRFRSSQVKGPEKTLRLLVHFHMDAKTEAQKAPPVRVDAAFEADYVLAEGFVPTAEHVKAFRAGNAIFNLWPYFREYLQTTLVRMALPPLTAPFLRLQPAYGGRRKIRASQREEHKR